MRNTQQSGEGSNFFQFGGGGQAQLMRRGLWLRAEGLSSRNVDILRDRTIPHEQFSFGLNGEIARNTIIGVNLYADRFADATLPGADPWTLRSTLRVSRNFPSRTSIRVVEGDAANYQLPAGDLVLYLYNPFGEPVVARVVQALEAAMASPFTVI